MTKLMKKTAAILAAVLLGLAPVLAGAEGFVLPGASSGPAQGAAGSLPEPADYFDNAPVLTQSGYVTDGRTFDCYDIGVSDGFGCGLMHWLDDCRSTGFAVTEESVGGEKAWVVRGEKTAYLFPEHRPRALLMVEEGMERGTAPQGEYVYVTWNGVTTGASSRLQMNGRGILHREYSITAVPERSVISSLTFTIPNYARSGDVFTGAKVLRIPGLDLYITRSGGLPELYVFGDTEFGNNGFAASTDYYVLTVKKIEPAGGNERITGTIRARFLYESEILAVDFCVLVPYT